MPLMAAGGAAACVVQAGSAGGAVTTHLTLLQLQPIVSAAIARLSAAGLSASQQAALASISLAVADLPGAALGLATPHSITLDANAAGYGWFIDPTPLDDHEFLAPRAAPAPQQQHMDLLTAVMHELGHTLGLDDLTDSQSADDLMYESLAAGVRKALPDAAVDAAIERL
jgi:hypothetical protein